MEEIAKVRQNITSLRYNLHYISEGGEKEIE